MGQIVDPLPRAFYVALTASGLALCPIVWSITGDPGAAGLTAVIQGASLTIAVLIIDYLGWMPAGAALSKRERLLLSRGLLVALGVAFVVLPLGAALRSSLIFASGIPLPVTTGVLAIFLVLRRRDAEERDERWRRFPAESSLSSRDGPLRRLRLWSAAGMALAIPLAGAAILLDAPEALWIFAAASALFGALSVAAITRRLRQGDRTR